LGQLRLVQNRRQVAVSAADDVAANVGRKIIPVGGRDLHNQVEAGAPAAGADCALRRFIETSGRCYVLAVTSAQRLGLKPVEDWLEDVPAAGWARQSAGAKGPRYDWAYLPYRSNAAAGWQKGLLIRRKIANPNELTFYLTLAPATTTRAELARIAGTRWMIEACFEAAKGEGGLDEYEARSWTGWHRHITLAMLAHAYPSTRRGQIVEARRLTVVMRGHRPSVLPLRA